MSRCYSCFKEVDDAFEVCPHCGQIRTSEAKEPIYLKPGTVLIGRYLIGEAIGSGGFGIIYKAWDLKLETIVAVKEFFASKLMTRAAGQSEVIVSKKAKEEFDYRKTRFLAEARNMAKFGNHRSIPNVFEFFEANGTGYIVMELLRGEALNEYLHSNGGKIDPGFSLFVINEVGNALVSLHEKGIIHRDVAPDNIFVCSGGEIRIKLLDLGAAKLADSPDDVVDIILKPGYSPVEQYDNTNNIGTWSDVYALGATLYVMLTGIKPDESTNRKINDTLIPPHDLDASIPENLSNAIMKAMAIDTHMRFKTVTEFLKAINGEKKVMTLAKERKLKKRRRFTGIFAAVFLIAIIGTVVFYSFESKKKEELLDPASISIWFSVADGSTESTAMESIKNDFMEKYPDITIELEAIPEEEYESKLIEAAQSNQLPTIFESTNLPEEVLQKAMDVDNILESDIAKDTYFLTQYDQYYSNHKQLPLGIEIPMAVVITNGATSVDYSKEYFSSLDDFGQNVGIALDDNAEELLQKDYKTTGLMSKDVFYDNESNKAAVLLSSTMHINEVRSNLTSYTKEFVYPDNKSIHGKFVYEWSLGNGTKDEILAAEKLMSWMLGNVYQNMLMISMSSEGEIPINAKTFDEKMQQNYYTPIKKIKDNLVFEKIE